MSVYITAKYSDCIQILTDAAAYTPESVLVRVMDKCWYSSRIPFAMTGRGHASTVEKIAMMAVTVADKTGDMNQVRSFLNTAAAKLRSLRGLISENEAHSELVAAFYDENEGFVQQAVWTHDGNSGAPYEWTRMEGWMIGAPSVGREEEVKKMASQIDPNDPRFLPTFGAKLVDLMREDLSRPKLDFHPGVEWMHGASVGGHVRLTTVTKTGVESVVLKTYNDAIGEPINPYRDAGNVTPISNLRKRRLEKKKVKAEKKALRQA